MRVYIAAKYKRRFDLQGVANDLRAMDHEVTSRWLDNGEEEAGGPAAAAQMDLDDVLSADTILFIGEPHGSLNTGGGRWFELGIAYANHLRCLVVLGDNIYPEEASLGTLPGHETVFTALPEFEVYSSIQQALEALK